MAGSDEDGLVDLLRPFFLDEVDLLHVAKTLAFHTITVDVLLVLSESAQESLIKKLFPAAPGALEHKLKTAISSRNILHGSSSTPLTLMEKMEKKNTEMFESIGNTLKRMREEMELESKSRKRMREEMELESKSRKRMREKAESERKSKKVSHFWNWVQAPSGPIRSIHQRELAPRRLHKIEGQMQRVESLLSWLYMSHRNVVE